MPKRTVGGPESELVEEVEVVASKEVAGRAGRSLVRRVNRGSKVELVPELRRSDAAVGQYAALPAATGHEDSFGPVFSQSILDRGEYFRHRKVVERELLDGGVVVSVAPRLPVMGKGESVVPAKDRKYQLVQFFTDSYLREKFDLGMRVYESLREQALADADAAAVRLQRLVREIPGCETFRVEAGQYSRSKRWAKDSVRRAAAAARPIENIMDCRIYGNKISIYGPGPEDKLRWSVTAPVWETAVAHQVHKIVQTTGTAPAMFALGAELTILDVDIHNGHSFESPCVEKHVGSQVAEMGGQSPVTMSALSAEARGRLERLAGRLLPVTSGVDQVATAVSLGKVGLLVNSHVLEYSGEQLPAVHGHVLRADRQVSRDLWLAQAGVSTGDQVWTLRDAVPGEPVFVCYSHGGTFAVTAPVTVRASDGVTLSMSTTAGLGHGVSGGAVLAVSDLALLGVYEGSGVSQAVGLAFTVEHFTDLCACDGVSSVSVEHADAGEEWVRKFQSRGLGEVIASVIDSLVPLYGPTGQHLGCAVAQAGVLSTTVPVGAAPVQAGLSGVELTFAPANGVGLSRAEAVGVGSGAGPMLVRKPSLFERVVLVGRDGDGPYCTVGTATVTEVVSGGGSFTVSLLDSGDMLPLGGAAAVAVSDGAVLGLFGNRVTTGAGEGVLCQVLQRRHAEVISMPAVAVIGKVFPMLRPEVWPAGVAELVLGSGSACESEDQSDGLSAYAFLGETALVSAVGEVLMTAGVPYAGWQEAVMACRSEAALAVAAERVGLVEHVRVAAGGVFPVGPGLSARVLSAVAGAVYKYESFEALKSYAAFIGMLRVS